MERVTVNFILANRIPLFKTFVNNIRATSQQEGDAVKRKNGSLDFETNKLCNPSTEELL